MLPNMKQCNPTHAYFKPIIFVYSDIILLLLSALKFNVVCIVFHKHHFYKACIFAALLSKTHAFSCLGVDGKRRSDM